MAKVVVDPVTRIEGHLRVEVEVENGVVVDARSSGTMARGFEVLLEGRDPRDATYVTERVCGVCAGSHGWASSLALDDAFGANVPPAGRIIRNLILGAMWLHDHPLHFYHLSALDYLDLTAVLKYNGKDPTLLATRDKVARLAKARDLSPLMPMYAPDEYSVKDPELVTLAVTHYLKALEMQAKAKKMSAIFAGMQPHQSSIVVGGVTVYPTPDKVAQYRSLLAEQIDFITNVYVPDVLLFGTGPLLPLAKAGVGGGRSNYLAYGGFVQSDGRPFLKPGVIVNGGPVGPLDTSKITEAVKYSWYEPGPPLPPAHGRTVFDLDKPDAYSFLKAPRYDGLPMEVGPLARMLIMAPPELTDLVMKYGVKPGAVARHAARAIETLLIARAMPTWVDELQELLLNGDVRIHDTDHWEPPASSTGIGLTEAPRGALGHWVRIGEGRIANYQMVVPSTWNLSPRDDGGLRGPVEEALIGTPVPDPENPLNVVRVIRSFDPCLSCAVHVIRPNGKVREFAIAL